MTPEECAQELHKGRKGLFPGSARWRFWGKWAFNHLQSWSWASELLRSRLRYHIFFWLDSASESSFIDYRSCCDCQFNRAVLTRLDFMIPTLESSSFSHHFWFDSVICVLYAFPSLPRTPPSSLSSASNMCVPSRSIKIQI